MREFRKALRHRLDALAADEKRRESSRDRALAEFDHLREAPSALWAEAAEVWAVLKRHGSESE